MIKDDQLQNVLSRLTGVRKSNGGYEARCPGHDDQHTAVALLIDKSRSASSHMRRRRTGHVGVLKACCI